MKQFKLFVLFAIVATRCIAQNNIDVTTNQTTCLIFPAAIKFVDCGSDVIATMQTKEAETMLLVKALKSNFTLTNLSVVTKDGKLYSFTVHFDSLPGKMVYYPERYESVEANPKDKTVETLSTEENLLHVKKTWAVILKRKSGIYASLDDIYIKGGVYFFRFMLRNTSPIRYDVEGVRMYITDLKNGKRTAIQEREISPIHTAGNIAEVDGRSASHFVVATNKFTLADGKYFGIEIREANGGRHFKMKLRNGYLMRAKTLN